MLIHWEEEAGTEAEVCETQPFSGRWQETPVSSSFSVGQRAQVPNSERCTVQWVCGSHRRRGEDKSSETALCVTDGAGEDIR